MPKTLKASRHQFSDPSFQVAYLEDNPIEPGQLSFVQKLKGAGIDHLQPVLPEIFQVNVGYMCNQTCKHCHVDAGPDRKEIMDRETMELCIEKIREYRVDTVDITGGAPEMNPDFRWFVEELRSSTGVQEIIVRSNLTIIVANPKYQDLPDFFMKHRIRIISSLPFYNASKTDRQRGEGVFEKSIRALRLLNDVGYGKEKEFILDLVYNPGGAFLPDDQKALEGQYKKTLFNDFGVLFNRLFALTNLPISRFLDYLVASGNYDSYMDRLINSFNPTAVENLMCRNTISIDYRGFIYDCDFNQMLAMRMNTRKEAHLTVLGLEDLMNREIRTGKHCFGCTAGAGSSCQGSIAS